MKTVTLYRPGILENALSGFDRYMDSFFGDNFVSPSERIFNRLPLVDVQETEKSYILEAELPGFDEKDVEVRLENFFLTIASKTATEKNTEETSKDISQETSKEDPKEACGKKFLIRERRISSFSRSFRLPENSDPESIKASFRNGILSLEISKRSEAQTKVIQISKD